MVRNLLNLWRNNKRVILGCAFLGGIFSCAIDFDHIWWWFGVDEPANWSGIYGRPFHVLDFHLLLGVWFAIGLFALLVRYFQSEIDNLII